MVEPFVANINFGLQIIILIIIISSLVLKKRSSYFSHGITMLIAIILNAISFLFVMGPSLFGLKQFIFAQPSHIISIFLLIHASVGTLAEIVGGWLIVSWRLRSGVKYCAKNRKIMKYVLILWLISLFSGFVVYSLLYVV